MSKQTQLTKEGLEALKSELSALVEEKRPQLVERLSFARSQGDLAENNDYQNAKDELEFLDGRIAELDDVIKSAVVVCGNGKKNSVDLGTKVTLKLNGKEHCFNIVGEWEADPMAKKISHTSPLGTALVGKKVGDKVEVEAPAGKLNYEILAIE
jgi:transcription elongation factor GreA